MAGDRAVRGAVRQETEPCGGWAVRGSPRHEPNHGGSVQSVRTAAVCGTVVNTRKESQVLKETIGKIVRWRKDKAGNTHPRKSITLEYLDEQAADQLKYYKEY